MFENDVPKHKIGVLHPLAVIDNSPYEFYRLAPPRVMMVMLAVGLSEFTSRDVERVFAPLDGYLDQLMERGIDLVVQNGVPLPLLIGVEAHDRMIAEFQKIGTADNLRLAYELGRRAFADNPDCDAVYVGGGAWLAEPAARQLENEFGKPVICNQTAAIREMMRLLNDWKPHVGRGRVLATP